MVSSSNQASGQHGNATIITMSVEVKKGIQQPLWMAAPSDATELPPPTVVPIMFRRALEALVPAHVKTLRCSYGNPCTAVRFMDRVQAATKVLTPLSAVASPRSAVLRRHTYASTGYGGGVERGGDGLRPISAWAYSAAMQHGDWHRRTLCSLATSKSFRWR